MNNIAWSVTLLFKAYEGLCSVEIRQVAMKQTIAGVCFITTNGLLRSLKHKHTWKIDEGEQLHERNDALIWKG